jgi:hypothetical protein
MRDEMIGAVVRRAMEHPEFRDRLVDDPQKALSDHGFALEANEMEQIEKLRQSIGDGDRSDIQQKLVTIAEQYGVHPRTEGDKA